MVDIDKMDLGMVDIVIYHLNFEEDFQLNLELDKHFLDNNKVLDIDMVDIDMVDLDMVRSDMVGFDMVGFDMVDFDMVDFDMVGFDMVDIAYLKHYSNLGLNKYYQKQNMVVDFDRMKLVYLLNHLMFDFQVQFFLYCNYFYFIIINIINIIYVIHITIIILEKKKKKYIYIYIYKKKNFY